jgi:hypothetical protein
MATTRNPLKDTVNSNGEAKHLLDELILIQNNCKHTSSSWGDMLIYIHEKSHCYNICKLATDVKCDKRQKA